MTTVLWSSRSYWSMAPDVVPDRIVEPPPLAPLHPQPLLLLLLPPQPLLPLFGGSNWETFPLRLGYFMWCPSYIILLLKCSFWPKFKFSSSKSKKTYFLNLLLLLLICLSYTQNRCHAVTLTSTYSMYLKFKVIYLTYKLDQGYTEGSN